MVRTVKYSLVLSFLLAIGFFTVYSNAATLIIENNTNLTLQIIRDSNVSYSTESIVAVVPPVTEHRINMSKGYWDIQITPVVPRNSTDKYPTLTRQITFNNHSSVKRIVLVDRDFGKSFIAGPPCDPSMEGKYSNLLKRISVPQDKNRYGKCHDYGKWTNTSYAGYYNLPQGYWVYMSPDWYIWGNSRSGGTTSGCDTTMGGKYSNKLRTVSVPKDETKYGKCNDYGWWGNTEYKGYKNLPKGYWVYDAPNWIIYGNKR